MSDTNSLKNSYLDQVQQDQQALEQNLKAKRSASPMVQRQRMAQGFAPPPPESPQSNAVDVRITGFGWWKTVVVPPNAYVVHTRRGHPAPLHLGLGVSFRYDPSRDAFLVVPGAMQTILINAKSICAERQGILVQGYVQWIIQDFATAYKKLDFSDAEDPMRLVALQLREQAEAAIKDKVATMSIDAVLADKEPIIEELTTRLRGVAEGAGGTDQGLGLRIVTVQIKEAVVSSTRLWDNLQRPFRAEREKLARLAELDSEAAITSSELTQRQKREGAQLEVDHQLATQRSRAESETFDREQAEQLRRNKTEQENARARAAEENATLLRTLELQKQRHAAEVERERIRAEAQLTLEKLKLEGQLAMQVARAETDAKAVTLAAQALAAKQQVENSLTPAAINARIVAALPVIIEKLPKANELKQVHIGAGADGLTSAVTQVMGALQALRDVTKSSP